MSYELGKNTRKNLRTVLKSGNPDSHLIVKAVEDFINYTTIDFCIIKNGGYRTAEEQNNLFKRGSSKCDGYNNLSMHQKGLAVDLVPWVKGKPSWEERACFYLSGQFALFCKLHGYDFIHGADWNESGQINNYNSWDPCHHELRSIK